MLFCCCDRSPSLKSMSQLGRGREEGERRNSGLLETNVDRRQRPMAHGKRHRESLPGLEDALESVHIHRTAPRSKRTSSAHPSSASACRRHDDSTPPITPGQGAVDDGEVPLLPRRTRRNSLDERRLPPVLEGQTGSLPQTSESSTSANTVSFENTPPRSRSGTGNGGRTSRELLRRCSTDTNYTLDFDSDVGRELSSS